MDFGRLAAELVRELRGARTQQALSRALGYRSNVLFAWERQRDAPRLDAFFRLLRQLGRSPAQWLCEFGRGQGAADIEAEGGIAAYLTTLAAGRSIQELAGAIGESRYVVSRWLSGKTAIPLPAFLQFLEVTTLSVLDAIALLVDPRALPSAKAPYERLEAARRSAKQRPWSHAIVHMVELPSYRCLPRHRPGWFASRLGITLHEEAECLKLLVQLGRLTFDGHRYESCESLAVDTRPDPEATRSLAAFWMRQGAERVLVPGTGKYAFNTFGISRVDLARLQELQRRYFAELRTIVSGSATTEAVAVATFQLFHLAVEDG